jgi:hypothetical protein
MRSLLAGIVAIHLLACGTDNAPKAAPRPAEDATVSAPRFLVVSLRRIQIIDRHPEDGDVMPEVGDDGRYVVGEIAARAPDRRPEVHTYEATLAVPENVATTFELTLDPARDYKLVLLSRGWITDANGDLRVDGYESGNVQIHAGGSARQGPNASRLDQLSLHPEKWHATQVMREQGEGYLYLELEELRYGPITSSPPADAQRGVAESPADQEQRRMKWPAHALELP